MERHSHGRLYVKGLPPEWTWWETHQWVTKTLCLPAPSWVHMHSRKPGADVVSAYLHWHKPTVGQLTTYQEHLSNKFLTHRRTEASIAQDEFGPPKSKPPQPSPYGQATWLKQDVPRYKTFSCRGRQRTQGWWHKLDRNGNPGSCPCCNHPVRPDCLACKASGLLWFGDMCGHTGNI